MSEYVVVFVDLRQALDDGSHRWCAHICMYVLSRCSQQEGIWNLSRAGGVARGTQGCGVKNQINPEINEFEKRPKKNLHHHSTKRVYAAACCSAAALLHVCTYVL